MLPAARIEAVIELLADVIATPRPADATISAYFRDRRFIGSKDRQAISVRIYRIIRSFHRLSWWIEKCGGPPPSAPDARALVIADIMFEREHNVASLSEIFSGEKFCPAPLTEAGMELALALDKKELNDPEMPLRERTECPEWAFASLQRALGDRFEDEMKASLTFAPLDLRVNTIKGLRGDIMAKFKKEGLAVEVGALSPLAIRVLGRPQISQHPLYMDGTVEIQDQGSQMIAVLADAKPGEQVADYCAGAGGKTLALGAAMQNKGRIVACDVLGNRLEKAKLRFRRAGLHNIETHTLGEPGDKWPKRHREYFDLVLVDAPCTGTGTWRREPDKRWRHLGPSLDELRVMQREILENASKLVKPGGRLVYATCSLLNEENEEQVKTFTQNFVGFTVTGEFLRLSTAENDTDGFFAAVLTRKA
jgi:16S rRNA (cytosine967-C5)-methyltransferase